MFMENVLPHGLFLSLLRPSTERWKLGIPEEFFRIWKRGIWGFSGMSIRRSSLLASEAGVCVCACVYTCVPMCVCLNIRKSPTYSQTTPKLPVA